MILFTKRKEVVEFKIYFVKPIFMERPSTDEFRKCTAIEVPGTPNGVAPVEGKGGRPGGIYYPVRHVPNMLSGHYGPGNFDSSCFNWAADPDIANILKSIRGTDIPGYALKVIHDSYRNDLRVKREILDKLKRQILDSREKKDKRDLYLIGHSLGAAIICAAIKELAEEGLIKHEEQRLYLILLAPAIGPLMGGLIPPLLTPTDLDRVANVVHGALETWVCYDPLSTGESGWHPG